MTEPLRKVKAQNISVEKVDRPSAHGVSFTPPRAAAALRAGLPIFAPQPPPFDALEVPQALDEPRDRKVPELVEVRRQVGGGEGTTSQGARFSSTRTGA